MNICMRMYARTYVRTHTHTHTHHTHTPPPHTTHTHHKPYHTPHPKYRPIRMQRTPIPRPLNSRISPMRRLASAMRILLIPLPMCAVIIGYMCRRSNHRWSCGRVRGCAGAFKGEAEGRFVAVGIACASQRHLHTHTHTHAYAHTHTHASLYTCIQFLTIYVYNYIIYSVRGLCARSSECVVYWYSFSNPRTRCIHCDNCLVISDCVHVSVSM